jgi:hypothetical protein
MGISGILPSRKPPHIEDPNIPVAVMIEKIGPYRMKEPMLHELIPEFQGSLFYRSKAAPQQQSSVEIADSEGIVPETITEEFTAEISDKPGRKQRIAAKLGVFAAVASIKIGQISENINPLRESASHFKSKINAKLGEAYLFAHATIQEKSRRNKILGAGLGIAALAGAYGAYKAGIFQIGGGDHSLKAQATSHGYDVAKPAIHRSGFTEHFQDAGVVKPSGTHTTHALQVRELAANHTNPKLDVNNWTWDVAHQVKPGHESSVIQQAMDTYSKKHNVVVKLVQSNGVSMIKIGGHINTHREMLEINKTIATL